MRHCSNHRHVWHVTAADGLLDTSTLRHGARCACGQHVICMIVCDRGCRHKRVVTKAEFDRLMEDS
jgi:hypothetical protein